MASFSDLSTGSQLLRYVWLDALAVVLLQLQQFCTFMHLGHAVQHSVPIV